MQPFPDSDTRVPRFREAREITHDLVHRDGWMAGRWLGFHPCEFELLWRLAENPGKRMSRRQLLRDARRMGFALQTRQPRRPCRPDPAKLGPFALSRMIAKHAEGGYFLHAPTVHCPRGLSPAPAV